MHTHTQARTRTCIHVHQYLGGDAGAVTSDVKVVHGNVARGQVEDEEVRVLGDRAAAMLCVFMRLSVRVCVIHPPPKYTHHPYTTEGGREGGRERERERERPS